MGLRQENLGASLGVSGQAVSRWERGETAPDIGSLAPLASLLDVSVGRLLDGTAHSVAPWMPWCW